MKAKRPVNLKLTSLHYPPMAIVSIFHRVSGVVLFILFPWILYAYSLSLKGESGFLKAEKIWSGSIFKGLLFIFAAALIYHFIAGIRHLLMDLGLGESLLVGRRSALFVLALSAILIIFLGIKLW